MASPPEIFCLSKEHEEEETYKERLKQEHTCAKGIIVGGDPLAAHLFRCRRRGRDLPPLRRHPLRRRRSKGQRDGTPNRCAGLEQSARLHYWAECLMFIPAKRQTHRKAGMRSHKLLSREVAGLAQVRGLEEAPWGKEEEDMYPRRNSSS